MKRSYRCFYRFKPSEKTSRDVWAIPLKRKKLLAVHGYLHLKGYDHQTKEDEKIMNDLTEKILNKANIKRSKDE